ncbi:ABC transporter [Microbacterium sp. NPDC077184]|uniref:ABC transporter n=1 Tax=Microbacterium sp. NPDC077184 TaxID=3154764 RepID=UPI003444DC24
MSPLRPVPSSLLAAAAVLALLTGCATTEPAATTASDSAASSGDAHGEIAGAEELAEAQLGLTLVGPGGQATQLDLLDESFADLGAVRAPDAVHSDGRYLFAIDATGVSIVDSGVWTWDHEDHFHYYRAASRVVGDIEGAGIATIATTTSSTTGGTGLFFPESGEAVLLDTEALSNGEIVERFRIAGEPGEGIVLPVGSFAAVAAGDRVTVHDADGAEVGVTEDCLAPRGTITTRVGGVIGCDDGAILLTVDDGTPQIERIPYPTGAGSRAEGFANREGRPRVAALAGEDGADGIWILDTRARAWTLLPGPEPLLQVTAVDDNAANLLALTRSGRVLVLDGESGAVRASTEPLVSASVADSAGAVHLIADQQRAYLSGPTEQMLWEIDFADDARIARTFTPTTAPLFAVLTGR